VTSRARVPRDRVSRRTEGPSRDSARPASTFDGQSTVSACHDAVAALLAAVVVGTRPGAAHASRGRRPGRTSCPPRARLPGSAGRCRMTRLPSRSFCSEDWTVSRTSSAKLGCGTARTGPSERPQRHLLPAPERRRRTTLPAASLILFGGNAGATSNETSTWTGTNWVQLHPRRVRRPRSTRLWPMTQAHASNGSTCSHDRRLRIRHRARRSSPSAAYEGSRFDAARTRAAPCPPHRTPPRKPP
jgi:hypothetical protein